MGYSLPTLDVLWQQLSNLPTMINEADEHSLEVAFEGFAAGTPVEEVWHWFEEQHPEFSVAQRLGAAAPCLFTQPA